MTVIKYLEKQFDEVLVGGSQLTNLLPYSGCPIECFSSEILYFSCEQEQVYLTRILETGNSAMHDGCCGPQQPYLKGAANSGK